MERHLISKWLKDNQRTQKWLESATGISHGHISEFLQGKKDLGWENIVKICEATGIDMNALAGLRHKKAVQAAQDDGAIRVMGVSVDDTGAVKIKVEGILEARIINTK